MCNISTREGINPNVHLNELDMNNLVTGEYKRKRIVRGTVFICIAIIISAYMRPIAMVEFDNHSNGSDMTSSE